MFAHLLRRAFMYAIFVIKIKTKRKFVSQHNLTLFSGQKLKKRNYMRKKFTFIKL